MEIRFLGPLELVLDGAVRDVRGPGERAVLARLALSPGRVVVRDRLVDDLWGERLPADPGNALRLRVSKLRRVVGSALASRDGGYALDLAEDGVDAVRFERLVAARRFAEALGLWRGPPLAEFSGQPWAATAAARLEELRATALEEHVDERLAAGEHVALVAELESMVAAAPLRERVRGQQMVALYRCGRGVDALAAYQRYRRKLAEELGVEPSGALRELEARILRQDPALDPPSQPTIVGTGSVPGLLTRIVGRSTHIERLRRLVASGRLVAVTGPGGVGKTTLAIATAHEMGGDFPDGTWFVPLSAVTEAARVPRAIAEAIGVADPDAESAARLVTSWLARRRALLVLDNCEHLADACASFVEDLLRRAGEPLRVLVTSREALGVPGEVQMPLPPLAVGDAARLFVARAAGVAPDVDLDVDDEDVRRIVERLDGMPLAVELAAARVKTLTLPQIAGRLDDRFRLLTLAPRTAEARHQTLRATVDWSHDLLDEDERRLFRRLAVFRRGWSLEAAEAVCAEEAGAAVLDVLGHLVDRSLVVADHGRFRLLETLRVYAEERLRDAGEADELARRHARHFAALAESAEPHLRGPDQASWLRRLRADDANLQEAQSWASRHRDVEPDLALRLGGALGWYWYVGRQVEGRAYLEEVLADSGAAATAPRARAFQALSLAVRPVGCIVHPTEVGARAARESARLFRALDDPARAAVSELLEAVEGVTRPDPSAELEMVVRAREVLQARDDAWGAALADFVEMEIRLHHGHVDDGLGLGRRASTAFDALDDDWGRSAVLLHLGYGLRVAGRLDEAEEALRRAVVLSRAGGLPNNLARSLSELGELELARGRPEGADPWAAECEQVARDLGNDTLLALAHLVAGGASRLRQDTTAAADHYGKALVLADRHDFVKGSVRARVGSAATSLDGGGTAEARAVLDEAETSARALGDAALLASILEQRARLAASEGDEVERQRLLDRAQELRDDGGRPRGALERRDAAAPVTPVRR